MSKVFLAFKIFYQLHFISYSWAQNVAGKEVWKLAKENSLPDIFHGFEPPGNVMGWVTITSIQMTAFSKSFFKYCWVYSKYFVVIYELYVILRVWPCIK